MGSNFAGTYLAGNPSDDAVNVTITGSAGSVDTELPDAALLADNTATPTAPAVGSFGMVFDGSTWDLMRGTSTDGVLVNLGTNNDITVASLPLPSGASTSANQLADGHNVTVDNASGGSAVNIQDGGNSLTVDNAGTFAVQEDGAALTALQLIDNIVHVDDAAFTVTTDSGTAIMGVVSTDTVDSGDAGVVAMTTGRDLHISIRDASGDDRGVNVDTSSRLQVNSNLNTIIGQTPTVNTGNATIGTLRVVLATDQPSVTTGHDTTGASDGRKTITSAGTAEAIAGSTTAKWVVVSAETDNTNPITVGGSTVVGALATRRGTPLFPGDSASFLVDNLADVFVDVITSGEGVTFAFGT